MEILETIDKLSNAYVQYAELAEKTNNAINPDDRIAAMHQQSLSGHEIFLNAADALKEFNNLLTLEFDQETADAVSAKELDCIYNNKLDFVILEKISRKLIQYYEKTGQTGKVINELGVYGYCCSELSHLDPNKYFKPALDAYLRLIEYRNEPCLLLEEKFPLRVFSAFYNICNSCSVSDKSWLSIGWEVYYLFLKWMETDFCKKIVEKYPSTQGFVDEIINNFVGESYSVDPTFNTEEAEIIIENRIKKLFDEQRELDLDVCFDYLSHLRIMVRHHPEKAKDYYYELARYYDSVFSSITDPDFISGYNTGILELLIDLYRKADFTSNELDAEATYIKKHMLDYFRLEQSSSGNSAILTAAIPNVLFNMNAIGLFSSQQEKTDVIQNIFITRHISTYMHCNMVAVFSKCIAKWALNNKPELFVGLIGLQSVEEVSKNSDKIINTIHRHAMLHDIGKIGIQEVVSRQYRPITDEEFQIIKLHPDGGAKYLKVISGLEDCADTARGHHKFYNGQGGYPANFDNTKSPVRLIIDIVTLSDCLDAATDYMGRNYRNVKTAAMVVEEFRASAGVRYNPDLVELMNDPEMVAELDSIASIQRKQIFIESCYTSAMALK